MNNTTAEEERYTKRLIETAAKLGAILHKRGGHVKVYVKLAGPNNPKKGKKRA